MALRFPNFLIGCILGKHLNNFNASCKSRHSHSIDFSWGESPRHVELYPYLNCNTERAYPIRLSMPLANCDWRVQCWLGERVNGISKKLVYRWIRLASSRRRCVRSGRTYRQTYVRRCRMRARCWGSRCRFLFNFPEIAVRYCWREGLQDRRSQCWQ